MIDFPKIRQKAGELNAETLACRRHLHAHPELPFLEVETARYLAGELTRSGIPFRPIADTGLLARIEGRGDLSQAVVLRADIDALPITENTGLPFASTVPGVMHACGHDIHAACLLGALRLLDGMRESFEGTIFGLFQPAEEWAPGGAIKVLAEEPFREYTVRAFLGQHVAPEIATGTFGMRAGKYMASTDEIRITMHGRGGHGALPHLVINPVVGAAELLLALNRIPLREADPSTPTVLSFGRLIADGATNVIPDDVQMEGTLRTFDEQWRAQALRRIREVADEVAQPHGLRAEVNVAPGGYPCVVNDEALTARAQTALSRWWGDDRVIELSMRTTGEDFGHYTARYPALFYRLGVGYDDGRALSGLHTPTFNPNEEALEGGVATLAALALELGR